MSAPGIRTAKMDFWKACELLGEDAAAKLWAEHDADQEEEIEFEYGHKGD